MRDMICMLLLVNNGCYAAHNEGNQTQQHVMVG